MPYDHSTKVGNQGDLVKHVALFAAIRHRLAGLPKGEPFCYAESNAGRPQYVLPKGGEWGQGIGKFSKKKQITDDRKKRKNGASPLGLLGEFDEAFVGRSITIGMKYPGSAGIAFRLFRQDKVAFRMMLWELDVGAADDCERFFYPWKDKVMVNNDDGYKGLKDVGPIHLALIDPPCIEHAQFALDVMLSLNEKKQQFLCWMPRTSQPVKGEQGAESDKSEEADTSTDYLHSASERGRCFRIMWQEKWGPGAGCSITVSSALAISVVPVVQQVTELMGWRFEE